MIGRPFGWLIVTSAGMVDSADLKPTEQGMNVLCVGSILKVGVDHGDLAEPAKEEEQVTLTNVLIRQVGLSSPNLTETREPTSHSGECTSVQIRVQVNTAVRNVLTRFQMSDNSTEFLSLETNLLQSRVLF